MIIEVRKAPLWPTYMVQVGENMFEMNEDANQPNGVCIYVGEASAIPVRATFKNGDLVTLIPIGMVSQIATLAKNMARI